MGRPGKGANLSLPCRATVDDLERLDKIFPESKYFISSCHWRLVACNLRKEK